MSSPQGLQFFRNPRNITYLARKIVGTLVTLNLLQ